MNKRIWPRVLVVVAITLLALPIHRARAASASLSVHIAVGKESLTERIFGRNERFWVNTSVRNTGRKPTTITVWVQRGWSWVSDNAAISPGIEATMNFPQTVHLGAGKTYNSYVEMNIDPHARMPQTFRLGFVANATRPVSTMPGIRKRKDVVWSNAVTLRR